MDEDMVTAPEEVADIIAIIMLGDIKRKRTCLLRNMIIFVIDVVLSIHQEKKKEIETIKFRWKIVKWFDFRHTNLDTSDLLENVNEKNI